MNRFFAEAIDIRTHPIKKAKKKTQEEYLMAFTYVINKTINEMNYHQVKIKECAMEHLRFYQNQLFADVPTANRNEKQEINCLAKFARSWRCKYRYMLVCDIALILFDELWTCRAVEIMKECLPAKYRTELEQVLLLLQNRQNVREKYFSIFPLAEQYWANKDFFSKENRKIIVTANMSAGKSTLINALIGKPVARTSQEACTGNICYFYNKAYEDGNIYLLTQSLNMRATADDLYGYDWNGSVFIASYFVGIVPDIPRLCIVDTPGVDAGLYKEHSKYAHEALLNDSYDTIIYVVSPTRLGTDAEKAHLQWVAQHLQKDKIIFVLNKLDDYHDFSDSIEESVHDLKEDLLKMGFENPVVCPISAYFSYLLKLRMTGQAFSEDEADEYALYSKKFMRSSYDLSPYYEGVQCLSTDSEEIALSKRVGLYGLEKMLYGGRL